VIQIINGKRYIRISRSWNSCNECAAKFDPAACRVLGKNCSFAIWEAVADAWVNPYQKAWDEQADLRYESPARFGAAPGNPTGDYNLILSIVEWNRHGFFRKDLHEAVRHCLTNHGYPVNLQRLVLEHPRLSVDGVRIAYCVSEAKRSGAPTVTTIAKYIRRHWPNLKDHEIRDVDALFGPGKLKVLTTVEEFIDGVQRGPASCMQWYTKKVDDETYYSPGGHGFTPRHPYMCYAPEFGWGMVIRTQGDDIHGRCITLTHEGQKCFVRSYAKPASSGSYSETDQQIEAYLQANGYEKLRAWPEGAKLAKVEGRNGSNYMLPFLDPGSDVLEIGGRNLTEDDDHFYRDDSGYIEASSTDGSYDSEDNDYYQTCEDCDESVHEDEICTVGRSDSRCVCESCRDNNYTWALSRGGERRYIRDEDVVNVGNDSYDEQYLSENEIVELSNGDYAHYDDVVLVDDEYYLMEDVDSREKSTSDVVYTGDGDYAMRDDCKWCVYNSKWYEENTMTELEDGTWVRDDDYDTHLNELTKEQLQAALTPDKYADYLPEWEAAQNTTPFVVDQPEPLAAITA